MIEFEEDSINIGNLGETKLTEWCDSAKITSNKSEHEDKMGWDHYIEFPYIKSDKPKDKQPEPIECKIQVKSTFREDGGVQIKLSSLRRLARLAHFNPFLHKVSTKYASLKISVTQKSQR